jgi:hypothetical protein
MMAWNGTSETFRWNLVILAALLAGGLVQPLHRLGAPRVLDLVLSLIEFLLALVFIWAVLNKRLSVKCKRGEAVVLLALFAPLIGLSIANLSYALR